MHSANASSRETASSHATITRSLLSFPFFFSSFFSFPFFAGAPLIPRVIIVRVIKKALRQLLPFSLPRLNTFIFETNLLGLPPWNRLLLVSLSLLPLPRFLLRHYTQHLGFPPTGPKNHLNTAFRNFNFHGIIARENLLHSKFISNNPATLSGGGSWGDNHCRWLSPCRLLFAECTSVAEFVKCELN